MAPGSIMAYVPGFRNDLFISYSHGDNEEVGGSNTGWISYLDRRLRSRLKQILGVPPSIWFDSRRLGGEQNFPQAIGEQVSRTAALLAIVSPLYLRSGYCQAERQCFLSAVEQSGGLQVGDRLRIIKLVKTPAEEDAHRNFLKNALGFDFYRREDEDLFLEFPTGSEDFDLELESACQRLAALLRTMRRSRETVYLAEVTADLEPEREKLRQEMEAQGYRVLPERRLDTEDLERVVPASLESATLSVHLLGARHHGLSVRQAEMAIDQGKPMVVWISREGSQQAEPAQAEFVAQLSQRQYPHRGFAFLENVIPGELRQIVLDRLRPRMQEVQVKKNGKGRIYLICDRNDQSENQRAGSLRKEIMGTGEFEVDWPEAGLQDPGDLRSDHEGKLQTCDGVLLYWGSAREKWFWETRREIDRAPGRLRTKPFESEAIYVTVPDIPEKRELSGDLIIEQFQGFSLEVLEPFLAPLRKGTGSSA